MTCGSFTMYSVLVVYGFQSCVPYLKLERCLLLFSIAVVVAVAVVVVVVATVVVVVVVVVGVFSKQLSSNILLCLLFLLDFSWQVD